MSQLGSLEGLELHTDLGALDFRRCAPPMSEANRTLSQIAIRGGGFTLLGQGMRAALQIVTVVVLSRLLGPDDFGLIAMVLVVVAAGEILRDFGLFPAAVQAERITQQQKTNLFWINTAIGVTFGLLLIVLAPFIARGLSDSRLADLFPYLALVFVANGLQAQHQAELVRGLRIRANVMCEVGAQVAGMAAAVALAVGGFGVWALVAQPIVVSVSTGIARVLASRWCPGLPRRTPGMMSFFLFGRNLSLAQLTSYAASNVDTIVIGATLGAGPLGVYSRAYQIFSLPVNQALVPLTNVALPVLSRAARHERKRASTFERAHYVVALPMVCGFICLAVLAQPTVDLLLGEQWTDSGPILAAFAVGGAFQALSFVGYWVFLALGATGALLRYNLITKPLHAALIIVAVPHGINAVAWAYATALFVAWPICAVATARVGGLPARRTLALGAVALLCGAVCGGAAQMVVSSLQLSGAAALGLGLLGAAVGAVICLCAARTLRQQVILTLQSFTKSKGTQL